MATPCMDDTYKPLDIIRIQGDPHNMPQKFNDWIPKFSMSNIVFTRDHLNAFTTSLKNYDIGEHEDVVLNIFLKSLEGEVALWFKHFSPKSVKKWDDLISPSLKAWDTRTYLGFLLDSIF